MTEGFTIFKGYTPFIVIIKKIGHNPCESEKKAKVLVTQSYLTLCDPMDCSPLDSFVHGILQARILERVAISFSRVSSWPRNWTEVSCIAGKFFTIWATWGALSEPPGKPSNLIHPYYKSIERGELLDKWYWNIYWEFGKKWSYIF